MVLLLLPFACPLLFPLDCARLGHFDSSPPCSRPPHLPLSSRPPCARVCLHPRWLSSSASWPAWRTRPSSRRCSERKVAQQREPCRQEGDQRVRVDTGGSSALCDCSVCLPTFLPGPLKVRSCTRTRARPREARSDCPLRVPVCLCVSVGTLVRPWRSPLTSTRRTPRPPSPSTRTSRSCPDTGQTTNRDTTRHSRPPATTSRGTPRRTATTSSRCRNRTRL